GPDRRRDHRRPRDGHRPHRAGRPRGVDPAELQPELPDARACGGCPVGGAGRCRRCCARRDAAGAHAVDEACRPAPPGRDRHPGRRGRGLMSTLRQALSWLADGSHWTGTGGILQRLAEHLQMFALVMLIAAAIALPLGLIIGHARKGAFLAVNAAGIGRAIPSFGVLAFAFPLALRYHLPGPFAFWPTLITLVVLAVPPLLTNTYVAVSNVDA